MTGLRLKVEPVEGVVQPLVFEEGRHPWVWVSERMTRMQGTSR